jgi:hypothetical protein
MNALQVMTAYAEQIGRIGEVMAANKAASTDATDASKERNGTLADALRAYVRQTAEDGVSVDDGSAGLTAGLTALEMPKGTVKASGNHYRGFRKLLELGQDIDTLSTREAQAAVESDEVKAAKAAKGALSTYAKEQKWQAADWLLALDTLGVPRPEGYEEQDAMSAEDDADIREEAAA